jgi:hypothetical protein
MSGLMTILRFYHPCTAALLGDGSNVEILGWTAEQARSGVEMDDLVGGDNWIVRVAHVFGDSEEQMRTHEPDIIALLGFTPDRCEREVFTKDCGAREIWFEEWADTFDLEETIYVLWPKNEATERLLLQAARFILEY